MTFAVLSRYPLSTAWCLFIALFAHVSEAARPYQPVYGDPLAETWRWRTFPDLSGFSGETIGEAADGTIWVGSGDALWHFDGLSWTQHYADPYYSVGAIVTFARTTDGKLYSAGRRGMLQLDASGKWVFVLAPQTQGVGEHKRLLAGRDGSLWAATSWGALRFKSGKWTLFTATDLSPAQKRLEKLPVEIRFVPAALVAEPRTTPSRTHRLDLYDIAEDARGRIWMANEIGEILRYDPAQDVAAAVELKTAQSSEAAWALFNEADGLVCGRIPSVLPHSDGTVWSTSGAGGAHLNTFDGTTWTARPLNQLGLPEDGGALYQTRDGVLWLSARYMLFALRNGQWRRYERPEVPIPTARNFMMQSSDGALWIGGPGTEIHRIDYQTDTWLTLNDLNFHCETNAGVQWFLHRSGRIVARTADQWISYGAEDGLIDAPVAILSTRGGEIWAAGSHQGVAATARFDGTSWTRKIHDELSWGIEYRGVLESADGSLWFTAAVDSSGPKTHRAGILQYRRGEWIHHHQPGRTPSYGSDEPSILLPATQRPEPVGKFVNIGESRDGRMWAGRNILVFHDATGWKTFVPPENVRVGNIEAMLSTREGELWLGSRQFGALRYDGHHWRVYHGRDTLVANSVRSLVQTSDGTVWAATDRDVTRFDGRTWTGDQLPPQMTFPLEGGSLKSGLQGTVWVNRFAPEWTRRAWGKGGAVDLETCEFSTRRHAFLGTPPDTLLKTGAHLISPPGNVSVLWSGTLPWRDPKVTRLQFSYRLDREPWSPYTYEQGRSFFTLPAGKHRLEVRARDSGFNVDPTPAVFEFEVLPVVWRQSWFILLMLALLGALLVLGLRVLLERIRLGRVNKILAEEVMERKRAEEALRELNLELDGRVKARTVQLEAANKELEAFSYSVSHDLRAPLRAIDGFSKALLEDYSDKLDEDGRDNLHRVRGGAQRMDRLIDDMFSLARVTREEMRIGTVDLSALARELVTELQSREPQRQVHVTITPDMVVTGDARFLRMALTNLLGNAWKFTSKRTDAAIEFGTMQQGEERVFFVRDNGAGFNMEHAKGLFGAFRRCHSEAEFPGTGVGLATVRRIIHRHGGRTWAEGKVNEGATIYFTLGALS